MLTNFFSKKIKYNFFFSIILFEILINTKNEGLVYCDAPERWQINFSDVASPTMEGIINFNNSVSFVLCFIGIFVGWLLVNCIFFYVENKNSTPSKFTHSNELEIIWTSVPAIILLCLATPSFSLLYSMDEIADPTVTLKIIGNQWYWSYEYSDYTYIFDNGEFDFCGTELEGSTISYDSYMAETEGLPYMKGYFRLLETQMRAVLPVKTHIRLLVSSADVLHSWTVPSFGIKVDACPGRLNQLNLYIKRTGLFFGQCSEICGVNHAFMPIAVKCVDQASYNQFLWEQLIEENVPSEWDDLSDSPNTKFEIICDYLSHLSKKILNY